MGFSGKPSKGCGPCRAKRTKCDLALPACTQCVRKNRPCTGYRSEQDLIFKNETTIVVRRAKRKSDEHSPTRRTGFPSVAVQQPSRGASVEDEAVAHFFAHYNERYFPSNDQQNAQNGFDYVTPIFLQDMVSGGPMPDIVRACGLAGLANMRNCPELLTAAKEKQVKVLRQLNEQLRNAETASSYSSILTCLMLTLFETIGGDSPQSIQAVAYHLRGASTLVAMRGSNQFCDEIGQAIYARIRSFVLAHCLQTRDAIPEFIPLLFNNDDITELDYEPFFYRLLGDLCIMRAEHKNKGYVDIPMAEKAQALAREFDIWQPSTSEWSSTDPPMGLTHVEGAHDCSHRLVWLAGVWLFKYTARILTTDILIEWARSQLKYTSQYYITKALDEAMRRQELLCCELKQSINFYLERFGELKNAVRTTGGYALLWPLYVLSMSSTTTIETVAWIEKQAKKVAEVFGIRQGKIMAEFLRPFIRT